MHGMPPQGDPLCRLVDAQCSPTRDPRPGERQAGVRDSGSCSILLRQFRSVALDPDRSLALRSLCAWMAKKNKKQGGKRSARIERLPKLTDLHKRHRGLTPAVCAYYAEAASVCMSRHHEPPRELRVASPNGNTVRVAEWTEPRQRERLAWANRDDATRDGAYCISLAAVEAELGWVAISRAETRTGADYYVGPKDSIDLEDAYRLEVSGVDEGDDGAVNRRLGEKVRQALDGKSDLPAVATVVGFKAAVVVIREAIDD